VTSSHNIDFNELYNTTERISAGVRILDEQTMVIMRCGAAQKKQLGFFREVSTGTSSPQWQLHELQ
jgi:hypothetical protein